MCDKKYTPADFKSDQEIRWCPGCGDHAIIASVQKAMAEINIPKENWAVISGIGCSSRFPYYMNTYGFHTIHGRAAAIATGVKCANKDLRVIQISGDGDATAIGGNHFIHALRRNIDLTMLLFNNRIYGLTKGQYSPTSEYGKKTKTSPYGTFEKPFKPLQLALGAQARFIARSIDTSINLTKDILIEANGHKGTSLVEILQNCIIYNDGAHKYVTDRANAKDRQIILKHGEPMIFGKNNEKGLILNSKGKLTVVEIGKYGISLSDILIHDAHCTDPHIHWLLANMEAPELPVALGVIRNVKDNTYNEELENQIEFVKKSSKIKCMNDLLYQGDTWEVK